MSLDRFSQGPGSTRLGYAELGSQCLSLSGGGGGGLGPVCHLTCHRGRHPAWPWALRGCVSERLRQLSSQPALHLKCAKGVTAAVLCRACLPAMYSHPTRFCVQSLSRGGCQTRWHWLVNCDHGDSLRVSTSAPHREPASCVRACITGCLLEGRTPPARVAMDLRRLQSRRSARRWGEPLPPVPVAHVGWVAAACTLCQTSQYGAPAQRRYSPSVARGGRGAGARQGTPALGCRRTRRSWAPRGRNG
eukprot:SAG25_NODE_493_length_7405_cov_1.946756_6_plen_247_part_00